MSDDNTEAGHWEVGWVEGTEWVSLKLAEMGEDGISSFDAWLPTETARRMGVALIGQADWIEKRRD